MVKKRSRKEYHHSYYLKNKERISANVIQWRNSNIERYTRHVTIKKRRKYWLRKWKLKCGCSRCGYRGHYAALDFHHRNPSTKRFKLADGLSHSIKKLISEIRECEVICANCHRILHEDIRLGEEGSER